jgi:hypothetical protein
MLRCTVVSQLMSQSGQKQTLDWRPLMSALPPKADIAGRRLDVRFVPAADIHRCDFQFLLGPGAGMQMRSRSGANWLTVPRAVKNITA